MVERCGGPHLNGHNTAIFYYIMVTDGYNQQTDAVQIVDPDTGAVWPSAAQKFWYLSLSKFVSEYMQHEVSCDREHIGVHCAR